MQKIYFPSFVLWITGSAIPTEFSVSGDYQCLAGWNDKALDTIFAAFTQQQTTDWVVTHATAPQVVTSLLSRFEKIQAAGGLVTTGAQVLLIFRRGKWDLPKGKLDEGESLETCALREVAEETGVENLSLGQHLITTYHTYSERGTPVLKETWWYRMQVPTIQPLQPQTAEDIEECRWVPFQQLPEFNDRAQPSVVEVWQPLYMGE